MGDSYNDDTEAGLCAASSLDDPEQPCPNKIDPNSMFGDLCTEHAQYERANG